MSLKDCIDAAVSAGEVTLEEGQQLKKRYDSIARQVLSTGSARDQIIAEISAEAQERKRRTLLTETKRQEREAELLGYANSKGFRDPAEALVWQLEHNGQARFEDVKHRMEALRALSHAKMADMLNEFSGSIKITGAMARRFGSRRARLDNVVKELFGESTDDAKAAAFAKSWMAVSEDLRQSFNAAGGAIGKLEKWGLPQHHNQEALLKAGREKWVSYVTPLLDRDRMRNPITGLAYADDEFREMLEYVWLQITTDGWASREPTGQMGKGALFRRHADHRFLHYKDATSWLKYQKDFGDGDSFSTMMGHVSTMTRDIAFMERFGPNPQAMFKYLLGVVMHQSANARPNASIRAEQFAAIRRLTAEGDVIAKHQDKVEQIISDLDQLRAQSANTEFMDDAAMKANADRIEALLAEYRTITSTAREGSDVADRRISEINRLLDTLPEELPNHLHDPMSHARSWGRTAEHIFEHMRGTMNTPVNRTLANISQSLRNISTASKLGSAVVSALSDPSFQKATRQMAGMSKTGFGSIVSGYLKQLAPGGQQVSVRAGLILDSARHVMEQQARYSASTDFSGATGYIADRVLALSGLSPYTQAGKHAFGMDLMAHVVDTIETPFEELTPEWRGFLRNSGITTDDWAKLQTIKPLNEDGVKFLRPQDIETADRELALKYFGMVLRFTKMAVPEPNVRASVAMYQGSQPGTPVGEAARLAMQFKGFSVGIMFLHGASLHRQVMGGQWGSAALRGSALLLNMTILGAVAMQIKDLINGRDPRPMTDEKFWAAAFMQGGGLGIYGDLLFSDVNNYGGGLPDLLAGPVVGSIIDPMRNLAVGNAQELAGGEDTNIAKEALRFGKKNMPGGNIWYTRLVWERLFLDQLQKLADPTAEQSFRRQIKRRKKDYGQDYWWSPGDSEPQRSPDLSNAAKVSSAAQPVVSTTLAQAPEPTPEAAPAATPAPTRVADAGVPRSKRKSGDTKRGQNRIPSVA